MLQKIILARPRGFCAGVERAISTVERVLDIYNCPIYVRHQIVHNEHVVSSLEEKGVIFVEDLKNIPEGSVVIFSAHGIAPEVRNEANQRNLKIIDATCPLVMKVHQEAIKYAQDGYDIILIGHKGHQEVIGTMGEVPMSLVESIEDVSNLKIEKKQKLICLTQTTLSLDDTAEIIVELKKRFPNMITPSKGDICYATQNRQNAVKELSKKVDFILVVGSANSSNSNRLVDTAKKCGIDSLLISDKTKINLSVIKNIENLGVTSGASVPEILVQEVVSSLQASFSGVIIENLENTLENLHFSLPQISKN